MFRQAAIIHAPGYTIIKKTDDEKIKVVKSPDNKVPKEANILIQQALPEE